MHLFKYFNFQLFAEAGAATGEGGEGGEAGVNSADAGQSKLEELGVPADKREKWAKSKARRGIPTAAQQQETTVEASSEGDAGPGADIPYETIRNDPKYKAAFDNEIQNMIRKRLGNATRDREDMQKLKESIQYMAQFYELPEGFTMDDLAKSITTDEHFAEKRADADGSDLNAARERILEKLELERLRKEKKVTIDRQEGIAHLDKLRIEAEQSALLKSMGFNFDEAMKNDKFFMFTSPRYNMTCEQAYLALFGNEIVNSVKSQKNDQAISMVADTIRAGQNRVVENGPAVASLVSSAPYHTWSKEDRARFRQQAQQASARGETFDFSKFK